jgi:hypothetical protein
MKSWINILVFVHIFFVASIFVGCISSKTATSSSPDHSEKKTTTHQLYYAVDPQGNTYQVKNETVYKYDPQGNLLFTYSDKSLGNINTLDVSNPLRPLLFYKDLQMLVITDNTLSVHNRQTISFDDLGLYQVQMVATSRMDNGIWLYDQGTFQLKKMSQNWEMIYQSGNLEQLLGKKAISPQAMIENNGYLYLVCRNNGLLIFDMYGAYSKSIPLLEVTFFFPSAQFIYVAQGERMSAYHLKAHETIEIKCTTELSSVFGFFDQHFYGLVDGKIVRSTFTFKE